MAKSWKSASKARRKLEEAGDQYERWVWDAEVEWERRGWPIEDLRRLLTEGREEEVELMLGGAPPRFVPEILKAGVPGVRVGDPDLRPVGEAEDGSGEGRG